ncbi:putative sodium/potassium/calcium exchanger [Flavobacterium microcysteis]|uniref:DUF3300 domain-containing protein n=1 Tax=Flavobacterium microcysteis TaxID=2596891 RepID=A0A501Q574_9FLAO|nr:hypothetical protein [Flavobacterium microcysteis]TPD67166.1 hypothetical protein FJA49_12865 [Flavobacterium microcysteis]
MKAKFITSALFAFLFAIQIQAQDRTTVTANSRDISDNLDLRAVASIFGDSQDLADFERRLNDPKAQISNLDLNGDNKVDYLRVIETVENNIHLIIIQSVLDRDVYQDVATIEVERDSNNNVQIQVVGDVYMYGTNYIYEPVYVTRPVIFNVFWTNYYRPYYSPWYWSYYPTYYHTWNPYPIYRYQRHVHNHINVQNNYYYVNTGRNPRAESIYNNGRRSNGYERMYPNRSFAQRNNNVSNRYELVQSRSGSTRNADVRGTRNSNGTRNTTGTRNSATTNRDNATLTRTNETRTNEVRNTDRGQNSSTRNRDNSTLTRTNETRTNEVRSTDRNLNSSTRSTTRSEATTVPTYSTRTTGTPTRVENTRNTPTRSYDAPTRTVTPRTESPTRSSAPSNTNISRGNSTPRQSAPQQSRSNDGGGSRANSSSRGGGSRG